jgi:alginate O-acetyltransferase complex protein AlgI
LTMITGGFWHGAAWTFVLWGLLHGLFIGMHRIWERTRYALPEIAAIGLTFLSVTAAWVVFRAESVGHAISIWKGMVGINGVAIPSMLSGLCNSCAQTSLISGMEFIQIGILLFVCMNYVNAQKDVQSLQPSLKTVGYLSALFFTSIWMSGSHESFIYWQF